MPGLPVLPFAGRTSKSAACDFGEFLENGGADNASRVQNGRGTHAGTTEAVRLAAAAATATGSTVDAETRWFAGVHTCATVRG